MQISCRCKYCGHIYISQEDNDLCLEIDFYDGVIRTICRKCKKENLLKLSGERDRKDKPLPRIVVSR